MYNVLFVDDEPIYKLTIQNLTDWAALGFTVTGTAGSGAEALEHFSKNPVHAVITDLQMPGMDGVTLIRELRKRGFTGPILALSNYSDYKFVRGALTAGAFDYLIKINITREQLEKVLRQMTVLLSMQETAQTGTPQTQQLSAFDRDFRRLHAYLLNPEAVLPAAQFPQFAQQFSFPLTLVSVNLKPARRFSENLPEFLQSSVSEALQVSGHLCRIQTADNEFLFLTSYQPRPEFHMQTRLEALGRQLDVFLSVQSLITYAEQVHTYPAVKKFFQLTNQRITHEFYGKKSTCVNLTLENTDHVFRTQRELFISSVLSSLRGQDSAAVQSFITEFLDFCTQAMIIPRRIKNAFEILLRCSLDLNLVCAGNDTLYNVIFQIEQCATAAALVELVQCFFREHVNFARSISESIRPEVAKALLYINKHYMKKISLDDVAKEVGLSKEYVSRLFLREVGMNLFHYLTEVRMHKAAENLISTPSMLIKEVAAAVGFENQYFFSTKFKEYYGVSPNAYKAQHDKSLKTE